MTDNRVTLPINSNTWNYTFDDLPTFERGRVDGVNHEFPSTTPIIWKR